MTKITTSTKITGRISQTQYGMSVPREIKVGDRVRLMEIEEAPQEEGVVLSVDHMEWGISLVILVDEKYKEDENDDRLRECTLDHIEEVISHKN